MAQAQNAPRTPVSPGNNPGESAGLLASCRGTVYLMKNQKWDPLFGTNVYRLHLVRQGGHFILLIVSDLPNIAVKAKILLRFNTIFKLLKNNFFSLLDNGINVWGFDITSQTADAQTFAIVIQNTLISLKESHAHTVNKPIACAQQNTPSKQEAKGDQQVYLNNICLTLSDAISRGDAQFASNLAQQLAAQKAAVRIRLDDPENDERGVKDNKINVKVQVEDKDATGGSFRIDVAPQVTINQLQQLVQAKYNFPAEIQRWVISKRLPKPNESLSNCGIRESGHTLYLYLVSDGSTSVQRGSAHSWSGRDEGREAGFNRANSDADVSAGHADHRPQNDVFNVPRNDPRSLPNMDSGRVREAPQPVVGWYCPKCTFLNSPVRPGCEICSEGRPQDYRIPDDYVPNERERKRLELEQTGEQLILEDVLAARENVADHS